MNGIEELARLAAASRSDAVDEAIYDDAVRSLVDWLASCLAGRLQALDEEDGHAARAERTPGGEHAGLLQAAAQWIRWATASGYAQLHTPAGAQLAAPVLGALMPLAEQRALSGSRTLHAYVVGLEAGCRLACASSASQANVAPPPVAATLGAALACAKLLELDRSGVEIVLARALREASRSPGDAAHAGVAGLRAALSAEAADSPSALAAAGDGPGLAGAAKPEALFPADALAGWGRDWHGRYVFFKLYPCERALHAAAEACLTLRAKRRLHPRQIAAIELRAHPQVLQRSHPTAPANARQARRCLPHIAAAALVDGELGAAQFARERIRNKRIDALRALVALSADAALGPEAVRLRVRLHDGEVHEQPVQHALGSPARPLADAALSHKFRRLAAEQLATDQAERLLGLAWNARSLADVGALLRGTEPEDELEAAELPGSPLIPRM